jgi:hypothetical protein
MSMCYRCVWAELPDWSPCVDRSASLFGITGSVKCPLRQQLSAVQERHTGVSLEARILPAQAWAVAENENGNRDEARALFQRATEAQPESVPAWQVTHIAPLFRRLTCAIDYRS